MTPEELQRAADVMLAAAKGAEIEFRSIRNDSDWRPAVMQRWNWGMYDYRVKPKPIEGWVVWGGIWPQCMAMFASKKSAESCARRYKHGRVIKMVEVPE